MICRCWDDSRLCLCPDGGVPQNKHYKRKQALGEVVDVANHVSDGVLFIRKFADTIQAGCSLGHLPRSSH